VAVDLDGGHPYLKVDYLLPTGSYKDRGATVLVSLLRFVGVKAVVEDSSGNAGSAMAAYCAAAGITCDVYVPATASAGKLFQMRAYGATVHQVRGSREEVTAAALQAAQAAYYASHYWNPFFNEGTKTIAFEIWEQLGRVPDALVLPCGQGSVVLGVAKGFGELQAVGLTASMPKIIAVQAQACAPLYRMLHERLSAVPDVTPAHTAAEGIASRRPLRWREILDAVGKNGGSIVAVGEEHIASGILWAAKRGFFIEPTSASAIAGYRQALTSGLITSEDTVVVVLTGHGLKSPDKIADLLLKANKHW
jgi:threonine synthase